jgi:hypothetical protein
VLPKGFVKVRYFGFFAPGCRKRLAALRHQLEQENPENVAEAQAAPEPADSTHWTLPTLSRFVYSPPLLCWLLDFSLAPRFRCASAQERSNLTTLLLRFSLALVGFLDIQSIQMSLHESGFDLAVRLKFQIA